MRSNLKIMFEQFVGDGADLFVTIVVLIVGFAAAIGFLDFRKTKNDPPQD